jgi:hypothetical protein
MKDKILRPRVKGNVHHTESRRFKSLQIIIDSKKISYKDFLKKGGHLADLRRDVNAYRVTATNA